ncbi:MAG: glycosyltransferase family 4 protein [Chloroflexaceae bacterium]|jgi:glycosyltransferase involved in cell wall biosynthesis|nr:glycosyltransferase family 4 protein [Chloroflexaceae bacterium]
MKILYVASGIPVPGSLGGSTHAYEVARGLARRGHTVHLVASSSAAPPLRLAPFARPVSQLCDGFTLHQQDVPKSIALAGAWPIWRLARALRPDAIIERYYNFAGAGVWAAHRLGIPCMLEVNALIVDPPAVFKRRLDDWLGGPMRRWATTQCHWASRIVTPLHTTVPPEVPREKIVELPWGADVERFTEIANCRLQIADYSEQSTIYNLQSAIFLGSFRNWHGVTDFVRAATLLLERGGDERFVLVGDGPERAEAERLAAAWPGRFRFTGAIPYESVPGELAQANVGVAPFNTAPHPALRAAGFFWSPLKIYEYMAAGLPVITTDLPPLNTIIRDGQEGVLFREGDVASLAAAMARLLDDPAAARAMGARARARVVAHYSWQRHCEELERVLLEMV